MHAFAEQQSGKQKKTADFRIEICRFLVPAAGVEPARVISPTDFESASSANSNTPAFIAALF